MRNTKEAKLDHDTFEAVFYSADPILRVSPKLINSLFLFDKVHFGTDYFATQYYLWGKDSFIDVKHKNGLTSNSGWAPYFGKQFNQFIAEHPDAVKVPPVEKYGFSSKSKNYKYIISSSNQNIEFYTLHPSKNYLEIFYEFCKVWKTNNYNEELISETDYAHLRNAMIQYRLDGSIYISKKNNIPIISDNESLMAIPDISVKTLSQLLGMEAISLVMPKVKTLEIEVLMELRHKLKDLLPPFRNELKKLTYDLRTLIHHECTYEEMTKETKFIVESRIEPLLDDLKRKTNERHDKVIRTALGATLETITVALDFGVTPLFKLLAKMFGTAALKSISVSDAMQKDDQNIHGFLFRLETELKKYQ